MTELNRRDSRFCALKQALRLMARVSLERGWEFQVAGAFLVILPALLAMERTLAKELEAPPRF